MSSDMPRRPSGSVGSQMGSIQEIERNFKDRIAVLAIAYHNMGVEQEFMKNVK
jgi:hypothetical protein